MKGAFIATHNVLALGNQLDKIRTLQPCINKYRLDELGKNLRIKLLLLLDLLKMGDHRICYNLNYLKASFNYSSSANL